MRIDAVEAIWIIVNATALILTLSALIEARADRDAVKALNGAARELIADSVVRRETLRLIIQALLLLVILPGLFSGTETTLNLTVVLLMSIPVIILVGSVLDARDRRKLTALLAADLLVVHTSEFEKLASAIQENTEISQLASDNAKEAYHEANSVNLKIAAQGDRLTAEVESREGERVGTAHTAKQVDEIHHATVPEGGTQ